MLRFSMALLLLGVLVSCSDDSGDAISGPVSLSADAVVTFFAADPGDQAAAIASGDFNADGSVDIALGAANADGESNDSADTGEVYVFNGPFTPGDQRDAAAGEVDMVLFGSAVGENYGRTLAAGDFNDDGVEDLVIGAPRANDSAGRIVVLFGGADGGLASNLPATLSGRDAGDYAGLTMAAADLTGDGRDDLLIGALEAAGPDNSRVRGGEAYLISGEDLLPNEDIDLGAITSVISGAEAEDRLGETVGAGDVNGDGLTDVIVAAPFASGPSNSREAAGETYVFFSPLQLPIDMASAQPDLTVIGRDAGDQLGHAVAVGDRDGDGVADLALGAVSADGPENGVDLAGEVIFVSGTSRGTIDTTEGNLPIAYGPEVEARLGRYATAGPFDTDLADAVASAPSLEERAGVVYFFEAGGELPETVEGVTTLAGLDPGDVLGTEVFGGPPMRAANIDSSPPYELLISAPQADGPDNERMDAGEAYIVFFGER
jgi:hypothetical protein